ncbi:DNA polymerase IV [Clostridium sp. Cult2]|uniref:DNA polymerase IV n=1 Tax=Clostridium sp. Cult2 TaxID=2079003 RepID=UPI001F2E9ED9|nr:DNA polymerase IV [Clostridium sp. Cult2]MCF6465389.1 DNA polymerase IV [Clostridium sp. Cult2]
MDREIIHIDMDAFYASVEQRDNPNLINKPVIVGGVRSRGVVCTASYEARRYGVHSAMPIKTAKRLCPKGIYLPVNMEKYKEVSKKIHKIFGRYSTKIEPISIDEAFLDVTGKNSYTIAKNIKRDIKKELQLTASVGISINKFLAKLASDINKPDGLTVIKKDRVIEFLRPLPVNRLWGVGPKMEREFNKLGIYYIGDIQRYDVKVLISLFGKRGKELYDFSYGIDSRPVEEHIINQSLGEEETFQEDIRNSKILVNRLELYSINLANKLITKGYLIKTITVKIKYNDFSVETRSITLNIPTNDERTIFGISKYILLNKFSLDKSIRLIGLTLSNIIYPEDPIQLSMEI